MTRLGVVCEWRWIVWLDMGLYCLLRFQKKLGGFEEVLTIRAGSELDCSGEERSI